jgi:hypothetical protein
MDLKIAATKRGYDDIGAIMRQLQYSYSEISEGELGKSGRLSNFDVVFINCSLTTILHGRGAAKALSAYVAAGGTIYASDYAADFISVAFPQAVHFAGRSGGKSKIKALVVDKGLQGVLGKEIQLTFDMGGWQQIKGVAADTQVYLEHAKKPLLVSFRYGKGQVIYTCFHNHAQVSEQEAHLLRYLVLKPLMARESAELVDQAWGEKKELQETVGTVSVGQSSPWYQYHHRHSGSLAAMLNWKGTANLHLELQGPDGNWTEQGSVPPLRIEVPKAQRGPWRYRVHGKDVPMSNFPFVLLMGPAAQVDISHTIAPPAELFHSMLAPVEPELLAAIKILVPNNSPSNSAEAPDGIEIKILDD